MSVTLRDATVEDAEAVAGIYAHYVDTCTATFDTVAWPVQKWRGVIEGRGAEHPVIVAVDGAGAGGVVGFGDLAPYNDRAGYRWTVIDRLYVAPGQTGRGIGRLMLTELIERAKRAGHHAIVAWITADSAASVALHEKLGFERVGVLREVGRKFERWLDVVVMELRL